MEMARAFGAVPSADFVGASVEPPQLTPSDQIRATAHTAPMVCIFCRFDRCRSMVVLPLSFACHSHAVRLGRCYRRQCLQEPLLFVGRHLEHVAHQKLHMVTLVIVETLRSRSRENPMLRLTTEQAGRHRRSRTDCLWIQHPTRCPARLEPFIRNQET